MRYFRKIIGERLYLSPMNSEDAQIYTKWLNDQSVSGFLGNYRQMITLDGEKKALERMASEGQNFSIVRGEDDVLLGNISLMDISPVDRTATVGLFIGEEQNRGQGYGAEALRLILGYGFRTLNLHNIDLHVHSDNAQGIACYRNVGFKEYGRRHEARFKDGGYVDIILMEILSRNFNDTRGE